MTDPTPTTRPALDDFPADVVTIAMAVLRFYRANPTLRFIQHKTPAALGAYVLGECGLMNIRGGHLGAMVGWIIEPTGAR